MVRFLLSHGMHLEALREMRTLPDRVLRSVPAIELWLRIFTAFKRFEICEMATQVLLEDLVWSDEALEGIARFRLAQARSKSEEADEEGAKQSLRDALKTWPPIRKEIEEDPELSKFAS